MYQFRLFLVLSATAASLFVQNAAADTTSLGVVKVTSDPAGAAVSVDGRASGAAPVFLELSPGAHAITVFLDGFAPKQKKVTVAAGRLSVMRFTFDKSLPKNAIRVHELAEGGKDAGPGSVTVITDPPGLTVRMDNRTVPKTTPVAFDIHSGVYRLRIQQDGNVVMEKTVVVQAGRTIELEYTFRKRRTIDEMDPWQ